MGCLFVMMAAFFPRVADIILWIARPNAFLAPFGGAWIWPLLGIIFLPFTTLFYVFLWSPLGLTGWDWLWIVLAVLMDISHYFGVYRTNQSRLPGYSSTPTA